MSHIDGQWMKQWQLLLLHFADWISGVQSVCYVYKFVQYLSQTNFHNNLSWITVVLCRQFSKSFAINWEWEREWARKKGVKAVKSEVNWLENLWKIDNIFELTSGRVHGLKIITEMRRASAPLIHHLHTLAVRCAIKLPFNPVSITPVYTCSKQ